MRKLLLICGWLICSVAGANNLVCRSPLVLQALTNSLQEHAFLLDNGVTEEAIQQFPLLFEDAVTTGISGNELDCRVNLIIVLEPAFSDFIQHYPYALDDEARQIYEKGFNPANIVFKDKQLIVRDSITMGVTFTDDQKDAYIISSMADYYLPPTLNALAWFKLNQTRLQQRLPLQQYQQARQRFMQTQTDLSENWFKLPEHIQNLIQHDMQQWRQQREQQCGSTENAAFQVLPIAEKIKIYQCQTDMTTMRADELSFHPD